jgi:hypothetical protein
MTCCTVFEVRVAEKVLKNEGITCRVAHSLLPGTEEYVALFQISRRDEASFLGPGDVVTAVQAYLNSPLISSGISSRNLFDVVIADTQGCTVSAKILMQMIARARDSNTRVRAIVTDSGIVRMPGGPWQHERVDYASAAVDVQKHCKARAISDVVSIEHAKRVLRMADMEKAFGNRRGMITIGVEGAPCMEVPVDDEAIYAYVPSTFGSRKTGMMWVRFARAPYTPSATISQIIKENSRKERLSTAATQNANAKRIGELLCTVDTVGYERESLLARVAAHAGLDAKNLRRNFIPTLEAIVRREERAYAGRPRLHILSDDEVAAMGSIQAVRQEMRLDDVVEYARYERDSLRITTMGEADAGGKRFFTTIEERYEVHLELKAKHIPYRFIFDKVRAAKSARRLEASPETTENEPPDVVAARERPVDEPQQDDASDADETDDDDDDDDDEPPCPGNAPKLAWEAYLTYGVGIPAELNDMFLANYAKLTLTLEANQIASQALDEGTKELKKLITAANRPEVKEQFRALYQLKTYNVDGLHKNLVGRCRGKSTKKGDPRLECWLAIDDVLKAAGWPNGVFDDSKVEELMQQRGADWENPVHAEDRARTEAVMTKLSGVATTSAREISMKRINAIIRRYLYKDRPNKFMKIELMEVRSPALHPRPVKHADAAGARSPV